MRIGIDYHFAEKPGAGNATHVINLVDKMVELDKQNTFFLYVIDKNNPHLKKFEGCKNVRIRELKFRNAFLRYLVLGIRTFIDKIDVLHVQYNSPLFFRGKMVVTVHDIIYHLYPSLFKKLERIRLELLVPLTIKLSKKVIAVSKHTANGIRAAYKTPVQKIRVIYNGKSEIFKPTSGREILDKYNVKKKYFLFVGRIDVRKNVPLIIEVFNKVRREEEFQLVIIGKKDFKSQKVYELIDSSPYREDIIFTGYVSDKYLPVFYSNALALLYVSLYEGFGLPCLEAMACGCPVISSNVSSIPEIVGNAGILIDPRNEKELTKAVMQILRDEKFRNVLRERGLLRAQHFNWEKAAKETLRVYNEVAR